MRAALVIDAPAERVRTAATDVGTWARAAAAAGLSAEVTDSPHGKDGCLAPGGLIRFTGRRGRRALFRVSETHDAAELVRLEGLGRCEGVSLTVTAASTLAGSLVTADVRAARSLGGARARILRRLQLLLGIILLAATDRASTGAADASDSAGDPAGAGRRVVVCGVVIRDGTVLAARRTYPPELAGFWECPGGKVESGESETDALARELEEELGITVTVRDRIGPDCALGNGYVLHAYRAELLSGEPSPTVHDAIRWVRAGQVDSVAWLPSDAPLVPVLRDLLAGEVTAVTTSSSPP